MSHTTEYEDGWVNAKDAAAVLGISTKTVRNWIDEGRLPAVRVGPRLIRIRRSELRRLITPITPGGAS